MKPKSEDITFCEEKKKSVLVVIPTLNEEAFIVGCLDSLARVDFPKHSIAVVVVDSGSEDRTRELALPRCAQVIVVPRGSIARSRNVGAASIFSEFIAFLDADCLVDSGWLKAAIQRFEYPEVVAVGSYPNADLEKTNRLQQTWSSLCGGASQTEKEVLWLASANIIVRRKAFESVGGFDERLTTCEDTDLGFRLSQVGKLIHDPAVRAYHLREPKTFREFFRKEMWHARSNLAGLCAHGFRMEEMPSVGAPIFMGGGLVAAILGIIVDWRTAIFGGMVACMPPVVYAIRGLQKVKDVGIAYLSFLYAIYFTARFAALVLEVTGIIRKWLPAVRRRGE